MESESTGQLSGDTLRLNTPDSNKKPGLRSLFLSIAVVAIGALAIAIFQSRAPQDDFQMANLQSMAVGLFVGLFTIVQLHRFVVAAGHRFVVPAIVVATVLAALAVFRWDGFSGEMVPQFQNRFVSNASVQQLLPDSNAGPDNAPIEESIAIADSMGFLGPNRNGVIDERTFGIPQTDTAPRKLWEIGIGDGWSSFAVKGDRAVTLEQRESEECLTCYRLLDGKLLWSQKHQGRHENTLGGIGPRSTPTIAGDRVYAQSATGFVWCVDLNTGKIHWTADLLQLAGWTQLDSEVIAPWGRSGSPLVVDELCILPFGAPDSQAPASQRSLIAFDVSDGSEVWRAGKGQISYASPSLMTLAGKRQVVIVNEKTVTAHHLETGDELWSFRWPGQSNGGANCASAIQVDSNRFLVGKGYGGGSAMVQIESSGESFEATEVWASSRILKTKFTHACVDGNTAYAISNGILEAVSLEEAESFWSQPRADRAGAGHILLVEDTIIVQNESGDIAIVQAGTNQYNELCRFDALLTKTWNIPTIAGRHLLVRNDKQAICFLLPQR